MVDTYVMPKWRVTMHVLVRRTFNIAAADETGAIRLAKRVHVPNEEVDLREDVMLVEELKDEQP